VARSDVVGWDVVRSDTGTALLRVGETRSS
jgi:hypothetical protein